MALRISDSHLILIAQGTKVKINDLRLGVELAKQSGLTIDQLTENALKDRLKFAQQTLKVARNISNEPSKQYRLTIARSYYAMYHTARALVFHGEGGDDFQEHSKLASKIPLDFPEREKWHNRLNTARLDRNRADYEPYPVKDGAFSVAAETTLQHAEEFIRLVRRYLKKKGCAI